MGRWISFGYLVDVRKLQKLDRVNLSAYTPPMTDTARNIEHLDPASTDGLADFFTSAEQTLITDRGDSDQTMIIEQGDTDQTPITTLITPDHQVVTALLARITEVESKLSDAQNALQSANWRNGYLESQLESQRDQIKLLTDSQHKPGWWQRFKQIWQKH